MLRWLVAAGLLVVALAGCSSGPGTEATPSPTATSSAPLVPSTSAAPVPVLRTDTLYLLDAPHMVGTLNPRSDDIRTPVISYSTNIDRKVAAEWKLPLTNLLEIKATLRAYVDGEGIVTAGTASSVCMWSVDMAIEHADGTREDLSGYCYGDQPVMPAGIRLLEFPSPQTLDKPPVAGDRLVMKLQTFAVYAPGATVDLLSGTLEHDSSLTIEGLQLPVDTQTLL